MASFDLISATPEWMIADSLWPSVRWINNCSFCEDLTGDICFMSFLGEIYNILSKKQMFFYCLHEGRCNYFCNVCLGFSV